MKKRNCLAILMLLFFVSAVFSATLDLSSKSYDELTNLYESVLTELLDRTIVPVGEDRSTSSVITFRNIPWKTSSKAFVEALRSDGIYGGSVSESYASQSFEFNLSSYGGLTSLYSLEGSGYEYSNYSVKDLNVGGFQVNYIDASFLYGFDDNNVYKGEDESILYSASYVFKTVDGDATYSVLKRKLALLYGEGFSDESSSGIWSSTGDYHVYTQCTSWYGADDTGVVLCHVYTISDDTNIITSDQVSLIYGKSNSSKMFNELKAAMAREELEAATSNNDLSGL